MSSTNQQGSKTPGQMLKIGSAVIIVPIVVLIFLIKMHLGSGGTDNRSMATEMVLSRIAPVALYNTGAPLPEPQDAVALTGEQVYNRLCMTCHDTGVTDAPIKGNTAQWAPRIAQGADVLFQHSLEGLNAMPAKGGDASLSDEEVKNAVVFMVNASGGDISVGESDDAAASTEEVTPEEVVEEAAATEEVAQTEEPAAASAEDEAPEEVVEETAATEEVAQTEEPAAAPAEEVAPEEVVEETAVTEEVVQTEEPAAASAEEVEASTESEEAVEGTVEPTEEAPVEDASSNQQAPAQESI